MMFTFDLISALANSLNRTLTYLLLVWSLWLSVDFPCFIDDDSIGIASLTAYVPFLQNGASVTVLSDLNADCVFRPLLPSFVDAMRDPRQKHVCTFCHKVFSRRWVMQRHVQSSHLDVRPYKCSLCSKSFTLKHHAYQHCRNVHRAGDAHDMVICEDSLVMENAPTTFVML